MLRRVGEVGLEALGKEFKGVTVRKSLGLVLLSMMSWGVAFAQEPAAPPRPGIGQVLFNMLPMFAMVFFIFYLLVLRPQEKKLQTQQKLLSSLKKGDLVATSGGIVGRVAGNEKDHILLEISSGVKIKVEAGHVTKRAEPPAKDSSESKG